jgi:hypothetical protein
MVPVIWMLFITVFLKITNETMVNVRNNLALNKISQLKSAQLNAKLQFTWAVGSVGFAIVLQLCPLEKLLHNKHCDLIRHAFSTLAILCVVGAVSLFLKEQRMRIVGVVSDPPGVVKTEKDGKERGRYL